MTSQNQFIPDVKDGHKEAFCPCLTLLRFVSANSSSQKRQAETKGFNTTMSGIRLNLDAVFL